MLEVQAGVQEWGVNVGVGGGFQATVITSPSLACTSSLASSLGRSLGLVDFLATALGGPLARGLEVVGVAVAATGASSWGQLVNSQTTPAPGGRSCTPPRPP